MPFSSNLKLLEKSFVTFLLLNIQTPLFSQHLNLKNKLAIDGYDPVAYFLTSHAQQGLKSNAVSYQGAIYYFSSEANKETFKRNPSKYVPQYGGWCAFAIGDTGEKVKVDPETFQIKDGKLYLFYNFRGNNTLVPWNKNLEILRKQADKNWLKIINSYEK